MKRILVLFATLGLLLGLFPAVAFAADPVVPTTATVNPTGAGSAPTVVAKWELPDADSALAGIQYLSDDAADFVPGPQIAPNLENLPDVQQIAYWWVATDPNGIADIIFAFVRVWHPDGTLKYQLHAAGRSPCSALGTWNTPGTPLGAAYKSGQMGSAQADLIVENCTKNVWVPFMAVGELNKHQPAGEYSVMASVSDQAGNVGSLSNAMTVLAVVGLAIDFTAVNFGQILPNTTNWVRGDVNFGTANMPSVKNTGNTNMYLGLKFSVMTGVNYGKTIERFDAQLNAQAIDPILAGDVNCFDQEPLGSNVVKQLDLSIHPGSIPADVYNGTLELSGGLNC